MGKRGSGPTGGDFSKKGLGGVGRQRSFFSTMRIYTFRSGLHLQVHGGGGGDTAPPGAPLISGGNDGYRCGGVDSWWEAEVRAGAALLSSTSSRLRILGKPKPAAACYQPRESRSEPSMVEREQACWYFSAGKGGVQPW